MDLVAHEQAAALHGGGQLRCLAAGRGAEVEHPLTGLRVQQARRGHGARLLQIVCACIMPRVQAGAAALADVIAVRLPRDLRLTEWERDALRQGLARIQTQPGAPRAFVRGEKFGEFRFAEQVQHSFREALRQHDRPTPCTVSDRGYHSMDRAKTQAPGGPAAARRKNKSKYLKKVVDKTARTRYNNHACLRRRYSSAGRAADL